MIRIRDITLPFDHEEQTLLKAIFRRLGAAQSNFVDFDIVRKSIDARRKNRIVAVYTVDVQLKNEAALLASFINDTKISQSPSGTYNMPEVIAGAGLRPVVVGSGPCGLFAGLILAQAGLKPILIERGKDVKTRIKDVKAFWREAKLDPESNVQFGEGGAGTFSDGKLTTQIKDKHNRCKKVLAELVEAGADLIIDRFSSLTEIII